LVFPQPAKGNQCGVSFQLGTLNLPVIAKLSFAMAPSAKNEWQSCIYGGPRLSFFYKMTMSANPGNPPPRRGLIFLTVCLGAFMATLDISIVSIALPQIAREFHLKYLYRCRITHYTNLYVGRSRDN
jgi:hypothetical protein